MVDCTKLDSRSIALRKKALEMFKRAKRGHIASSFSIIEIVRVLYDDILKYDPKDPKWHLRDRFILSKGHGAPALYILLQEKGFIKEDELWKFCASDCMLGGHPSHLTPGVEASTGALAHGLPIGTGFALNAKIENQSYKTYVLLGDGECNEGSIWEACLAASKHNLDNLIVLVDYNKLQSYGPVQDVSKLEPFAAKWRSFGFGVAELDGHDVAALKKTLQSAPFEKGKPSVIICHTTKGKGIKCIENDPSWHHKGNLQESDIQMLVDGLEESQ